MARFRNKTVHGMPIKTYDNSSHHNNIIITWTKPSGRPMEKEWRHGLHQKLQSRQSVPQHASLLSSPIWVPLEDSILNVLMARITAEQVCDARKFLEGIEREILSWWHDILNVDVMKCPHDFQPLRPLRNRHSVVPVEDQTRKAKCATRRTKIKELSRKNVKCMP